MQRRLPLFLGNHSPFLLPPKVNYALTRPLDTSVNALASSKTSQTREEPVSELQRCHVPALISSKEKTGCFFQAWLVPGFSLLKAGVTPSLWNQHTIDSASVGLEWTCKTSPHRSIKRTLCQLVYSTGILVLLLYSFIWEPIKDKRFF